MGLVERERVFWIVCGNLWGGGGERFSTAVIWENWGRGGKGGKREICVRGGVLEIGETVKVERLGVSWNNSY